jgi:hypothetical protein
VVEVEFDLQFQSLGQTRRPDQDGPWHLDSASLGRDLLLNLCHCMAEGVNGVYSKMGSVVVNEAVEKALVSHCELPQVTPSFRLV